MYTIYAIYNRENNKIYIGQTANLKDRIRMHNEGTLGGYTSRFDGKWEVVYHEEVLTRTEALTREKQLKSYRGREFVRTHIPL